MEKIVITNQAQFMHYYNLIMVETNRVLTPLVYVGDYEGVQIVSARIQAMAKALAIWENKTVTRVELSMPSMPSTFKSTVK